MTPPKPAGRQGQVGLRGYARLFRRDILSAQPDRLYGAKMAEFRTPFFRSFLLNEPDLARRALAGDWPKSKRIGAGLEPLLGRSSVFLTNGATWARQRRIIDAAFDGGRMRGGFPALLAAGEEAVGRIAAGVREVEAWASHAAADAIFRAMFSMPIDAPLAAEVHAAFRGYQRAQPLLNLAAFLPMPRWFPRGHRWRTMRAARAIRRPIAALVAERAAAIARGQAPDDVVTRIMTSRDPVTGTMLDAAETSDQVAIFFLAGHETSAAALAWALYLLATHPEAQARVADEGRSFLEEPGFAALPRLAFTRDVFRETLRLYPPVPMMVRETTGPELFRGRKVPGGAQIVVSPWHLHRNTRIWDNPDGFDPGRWSPARAPGCPRSAYLPFSAGPRVCPGAGFAMVEGPLFLALTLARWHVAPVDGWIPVPVAHLTVRSRDGIGLEFQPRARS